MPIRKSASRVGLILVLTFWGGNAAQAGSAARARLDVDPEGYVIGGAEEGHGSGAASSELRESSGLVHRASLIADDQPKTAWCEASADDGVGQWIELRSPCFGEDVAWLGLTPGYASSASTFAKNNRIKRADVAVFTGPAGFATATSQARWSGAVEYSDDIRMQYFDFPKFNCPAKSEVVARVKVSAVYSGSAYKDTCVSEVGFYSGATAGAPVPTKSAATGSGWRDGTFAATSAEWIAARALVEKYCTAQSWAGNCGAFAPRFYPPPGSKCAGQLVVSGTTAKLTACDPGDDSVLSFASGQWVVTSMSPGNQDY